MQTGNHEMILVIDFGGQYNQLIARRVRECGVYCEIVPYTYTLEQIKAKNPKGIIFTGGPNSVYGDDTPKIDPGVFELGVPVLGICYGHQLMTHTLGGRVESADVREYGKTAVKLNKNNILFKDIEEHNISWMSHTDYVSEVPEGFVVTADTSECPVAGMANDLRKLYGVQFHPEVEHTPFGRKMISNFLFDVCGVKGDWTMSSFAQRKIAEIKEAVGDKKVLCALSGGVDSSVAAVLVHKAVGKQLTCVFVDHGLLRKDEGDQVETVFKEQFDMNLIRVNAAERFLGRLAGVSDPETKRKIIGEEFIRVFEEEPLRELFKDEVRAVGEELGIPSALVWRQPFPGPGLAIRVLGEVTQEKLEITREADAIFREEIAKAGLERKIWQYFACLPNIRSVGVMGDGRTYSHTVALRAVTSNDGMTSDWAHIPFSVLDIVSRRIVNEVQGVNRIVYDITSKPPATIEWE